MNGREFVFFVFLFLMFSIVITRIAINIWSTRDHGKWLDNAKPSMNATIKDADVERVCYLKGHAKIRTRILFSDGYLFTSHRTDRKDRVLSYHISLGDKTKEQIISNAIKMHEIAVLKKQIKN